MAAAKGLVDKGAPWKAGMKWPVVMAEGIVLAVAGLLVWLAPGFGARAVLQVLGIILLATAALSAWRLLRDQVAPGRIATVAFRAGVGLSVGLIVVIGSLIAQDTDVATVAIAIILGIGLILYGLAAVAAALIRREKGSRFPVVSLVIAGLTVVVGLLLVLNGRGGVDSLKGTFTWLGILLSWWVSPSPGMPGYCARATRPNRPSNRGRAGPGRPAAVRRPGPRSGVRCWAGRPCWCGLRGSDWTRRGCLGDRRVGHDEVVEQQPGARGWGL